jgi:hypothetical protein
MSEMSETSLNTCLTRSHKVARTQLKLVGYHCLAESLGASQGWRARTPIALRRRFADPEQIIHSQRFSKLNFHAEVTARRGRSNGL